MLNISDPIDLFLSDRARCEANEPWGATACVLATVDETGHPRARYVLVKEVDAHGFFFYTNYRSPKAQHLLHTPKAALCFLWNSIETQFRIEGRVEQASEAVSDAYFASRPRVSQLGAWASEQSETLPEYSVLRERVDEMEKKFEGRDVPRPEHWGGFRLVPDRIEHWVAGEFRLHRRQEFVREGETWSNALLYP